MLQNVGILCFALSVISFGLFVYFALRRRPAPPPQPESRGIGEGLEDIAKVLEALAKLTDSFAKAGPMVMSLVASIFFMLIGVLATSFGEIAQR